MVPVEGKKEISRTGALVEQKKIWSPQGGGGGKGISIL